MSNFHDEVFERMLEIEIGDFEWFGTTLVGRDWDSKRGEVWTIEREGSKAREYDNSAVAIKYLIKTAKLTPDNLPDRKRRRSSGGSGSMWILILVLAAGAGWYLWKNPDVLDSPSPPKKTPAQKTAAPAKSEPDKPKFDPPPRVVMVPCPRCGEIDLADLEQQREKALENGRTVAEAVVKSREAEGKRYSFEGRKKRLEQIARENSERQLAKIDTQMRVRKDCKVCGGSGEVREQAGESGD